jgi:hypothetical protein
MIGWHRWGRVGWGARLGSEGCCCVCVWAWAWAWAWRLQLETPHSEGIFIPKFTVPETSRPRQTSQVADLERELVRYRKMDSEGKKGGGLWGYIAGSA